MIAHYTVDHCEDYHSSLWADISPATTLTLTKLPVTLPDNLALLPAPFFDRRDNSRVTVPFVLPANADAATLQAAGVVSSWLGALASYRELRPVTQPAARRCPRRCLCDAERHPGGPPVARDPGRLGQRDAESVESGAQAAGARGPQSAGTAGGGQCAGARQGCRGGQPRRRAVGGTRQTAQALRRAGLGAGGPPRAVQGTRHGPAAARR